MRTRRYTRRKRKLRNLKRKILSGGTHDEKKFLVKIPMKHGLGNQLFIVAAGIKAQKTVRLPMYIVVDTSNYHSKNNYSELFSRPDMGIYTITPNIGDTLYLNALPVIDILGPYFKKDAINHNHAVWYDSDVKYDNKTSLNLKLPELLYQNYNTIEREIPEVKSLLLKNEFESEKKKSIYDPIRNETNSDVSAFMHVRLGDYLKIGSAQKVEYYMDALKELDKNKAIKVIYVCCIDETWYRDNEVKLKECTKKELKYYNNSNELVVLYKMMLCEAGAVLSPSTFSAWGAMMGADMNPKSTIVYPKNWIKKKYPVENAFMFPDRWIKVDNHDMEGGEDWRV